MFFSQYFFGYEKKITTEMQKMGAEVYLYDEMSVKRPFERAIVKASSKVFSRQTERYYGDILSEVMNISFDYILFIDSEMPTHKVLKQYRNAFPNSKFCLHMWDSVENLKGVQNKFSFFDYISTFDRKDADDYKLVFRPLFFSEEFRAREKRKEYKYDLSFIGTIHSDRYRIIREILKSTHSYFFYPYLQSHFIYFFYKAVKKEFRKARIGDFKFEKLDSKTIAEVVEESKAVLDIQHPKQTGLTMRTLEMLGMKIKLITTNSDIVHYDFYNKNNICVIDRKNPKVPNEFYLTEYKEIPQKIYEYYSIRQWINDVLGVQNG